MHIEAQKQHNGERYQAVNESYGQASTGSGAEREFSALLDKIAGKVRQAIKEQPELNLDLSIIPMTPKTPIELKPAPEGRGVKKQDRDPEVVTAEDIIRPTPTTDGQQQAELTTRPESPRQQEPVEPKASIVPNEQPVAVALTQTTIQTSTEQLAASGDDQAPDVQLPVSQNTSSDSGQQPKLSPESAQLPKQATSTVVKTGQEQLNASPQKQDVSAIVIEEPPPTDLLTAFDQALKERLSEAPPAQQALSNSPRTVAPIGAVFPTGSQALNVQAPANESSAETSSIKATSAASAQTQSKQHGQGSLSDRATDTRQQSQSKGPDSSSRSEQARSSASRLLERVQSALEEVARSRDGKTISVRLDPKDLGAVRADISLRDGSLHARILADSAEVLNILRDRAAEIQQHLRKLGLNVSEITVAVQSDTQRELAEFSNSSGDHQHKATSSQVDQQAQFGTSTGSQVVPTKPALTPSVSDHWVA